ncbi:MAG: hypothetical protein J6T16_06545 [Opitutales bacterium]|nr:hypothetical protein [Opitutales bacterium]
MAEEKEIVEAAAVADTDGKKKVGFWLKNKGAAIGVAIGAALVATGDYLCGDTGIIPFVISVAKQIWQFI